MKGMLVLPSRSCACALLTMSISKVHAAAQPWLRCLQPPVLLPVHTVMLPAPLALLTIDCVLFLIIHVGVDVVG